MEQRSWVLPVHTVSLLTQVGQRRWNVWHGSNLFQPSLRLKLKLAQMEGDEVEAHV